MASNRRNHLQSVVAPSSDEAQWPTVFLAAMRPTAGRDEGRQDVYTANSQVAGVHGGGDPCGASARVTLPPSHGGGRRGAADLAPSSRRVSRSTTREHRTRRWQVLC